MDRHIKQYFSSNPDEETRGYFHKVIALHEAPDLDEREIRKICLDLPKGWYEVLQLNVQDRLDFVHAYWVKNLPFLPKMEQSLTDFFGRLDDICVYLVQPRFEDPFHAEMVYSLKDNGGFYRGCAPITQEQLNFLTNLFPEVMLPKDYIAFLEIHAGFSKLMDSGVLPPLLIGEAFQRIHQLIEHHHKPLVDAEKQLVNASTLIPFYESFSLPAYQCFWSDWYPQDEMGNIYFSGLENTISDVSTSDTWADQLAFPTFLDWLAFYLESINS